MLHQTPYLICQRVLMIILVLVIGCSLPFLASRSEDKQPVHSHLLPQRWWAEHAQPGGGGGAVCSQSLAPPSRSGCTEFPQPYSFSFHSFPCSSTPVWISLSSTGTLMQTEAWIHLQIILDIFPEPVPRGQIRTHPGHAMFSVNQGFVNLCGSCIRSKIPAFTQ